MGLHGRNACAAGIDAAADSRRATFASEPSIFVNFWLSTFEKFFKRGFAFRGNPSLTFACSGRRRIAAGLQDVIASGYFGDEDQEGVELCP